MSLKERLMHVQEAQRRLGSSFEWICDAMDNRLKHALGDAPNSEFVVDALGKLVSKRRWSDPKALRKDLEKLVGPVKEPTKVSDLKMKSIAPPKHAASGVVPRLKVPSGMRAVKIGAKKSDSPFYVKLRAEADDKLLRGEDGTLYIGFHLDPIHGAHWNNLVDPPTFEITAPQGVTVTPAKGTGPKLKDASDIDPREFLVKITRKGEANGPLKLRIRYFACTDTMCMALEQEYEIRLEADKDGGRSTKRGGGGNRGRGGASRAQMFENLDKNGDGKLTADELPERMQRMLERFDRDGDGALSADEMPARRGRRR
ncbi:MAG: EF-hand domain-containing protein [Planctomycetota bacterium]